MKVEIIDISDKSGSMSSLRNDVIGGFNTLLEDQKKVPGEARLTHIQFNDKYNALYVGKDIHEVAPLDADSYSPSGFTALLDAIGRTLNEQGERIKKEAWADKVIVCIRTDGAENDSREYALPQVRAMIGHAQKHGWDFIFTGANQDAFQTASAYGINAQYTSNFTATGAGMQASYAATSSTLRSLRADPDVDCLQAKLEKSTQV